MTAPRTALLPDWTWLPEGRFARDRVVVLGAGGRIDAVCGVADVGERAPDARIERLAGRALFPGFVNAHSHAFQRALRGRTQRAAGHDDFWSWRGRMYDAAARLEPDALYATSHLAFVEMALAGYTTVCEFHYLHQAPDGSDYAEPELLANTMVRAARDAGLRITLLRVAYARGGFETALDPRQRRFLSAGPDEFLQRAETLQARHASDPQVRIGVAPHSVRAVPADWLRPIGEAAVARGWPLHAHVSEQRREVEECVREHGRTPATLLAEHGCLGPGSTLVHGTWLTEEEVIGVARSGAGICVCPSTEADLADGIPAADLFAVGRIPLSLGTDSHARIDGLAEARALEEGQRLRTGHRNVLVDEGRGESAPFLVRCATEHGARAAGLASAGRISTGEAADLMTVDLDNVRFAGATQDHESLAAAIVFAGGAADVRDVWVAGERIVNGGRHSRLEAARRAYETAIAALWA